MSVGPAVPGIPRVLVDNDRGMKEMVNHLIRDHGYTRIGFISGPKGNIDADRRRKMYQEALTENSLIYEEAIVYEGDFNDHSGYEAVLHWISRGGAMPQAIVASNDNMAFGAINALREKGLSVPHQIAVTGFDDVSSAATATPPLSTVSQPIYLQGKKAVELLIQRIKGGTIPEETLEKPNQIYRQSCGCLSATITAFQTEESITLSQFSQILRTLPGFLEDQQLCARIIKLIEPLTAIEAGSREELSCVAAFSGILQKDILCGANIPRWYAVVHLCRGLIPTRKTVLHRLQAVVADAQTQQIYLDKARDDEFTNVLSSVERELITCFSVDILRKTLVSSFTRLGLDGAVLCLYERPDAPLEGARVIAAFRKGEEVPFPKEVFPTQKIVPESIHFTAGPESSLIIEPLYYREERLGYIVFEQTSRSARVYESLAAQISSALEGAVLIERVMSAEKAIQERSRQIEALVKPMMDSIRTVAQTTSEQHVVISKLEDLNQKSLKSVNGMEGNTRALAEAIEKTGALVGEINNISEVINVVAINASIEAAHVGREGAAFAVIAGEVRKLSASTRQNSERITGFLGEVETKISSLAQSNKELSSAFAELNATIRATVSTLETITGRMEGLDRGSGDILSLMNDRGQTSHY